MESALAAACADELELSLTFEPYRKPPRLHSATLAARRVRSPVVRRVLPFEGASITGKRGIVSPLHGCAILVAPKKVSHGNRIMIDITKDIQSLTTFRRRSGDFMKQLKKNKRPVVLTVKGKAAAIVQDAEAYQRLLDIAAYADAGEGIRQGLEDARQGKVRPARQFFEDFEAANGIPR